MQTEEATNPAADEDLRVESEEGVADEAQAQGDDQTDGEAEESVEDQPEDDTEEIEHEGAKFRIPKALKGALMMNADYTRKTQELAEERRTVQSRQAELKQQAEAQQQTLEERALLRAVEAQLQQYDNVDWSALAAQGDGAVGAQLARMQQLKEAREELTKQISTKEQEHIRLTSERVANARQEAVGILQKDIPGWSPQLGAAIDQLASEVGFTPREVLESLVDEDGKPDVRSVKVLARLHAAETELAKLKAQQTKAQQTQKQTAVQPAKTVGAKGSGYKPGLDDSLPPDEWLRRRNAQVRKA